jgi:hypothetical protein
MYWRSQWHTISAIFVSATLPKGKYKNAIDLVPVAEKVM